MQALPAYQMTKREAFRRIKRLNRELGVKLPNDINNFLAEYRKCLYDSSSIGWRPLVERYIKREICFHVHLRYSDDCISALLMEPSQLCAVFEWPSGMLADDYIFMAQIFRPHRPPNFSRPRKDIFQPDETLSQMQMAMLVNVPEFFENCKRLPFGSILPCNKWLQSLDVCAKTWPDPPEILSCGLRPTCRSDDDREADIAPLGTKGERIVWRGTFFEDGQLPDQIVKGRPKVVNGVSDEQSPFPGRRVLVDSAAQNILEGLRVGINFNGISATINKSLDGICQIRNMHERPL